MGKEKKMNIAIVSIIIGIVISVLSFLSMFVSVRFILLNAVNTNNFISYIILSLVLGMIGGIFYYFKFTLAFIIFLICTLFGFIQMYRTFLEGLDGWGDLAGFLTLLTWIIIGFILGVGVQFLKFLFKKLKKTE
ncbi:MAG: hypothetical protein K0S61_955 [Anaerocolumna sp.]|jgi:hypothetical protein|nr:hypothetical protein [Anaerocolumna sp.]